jgi:Uma2 family endonuclease
MPPPFQWYRASWDEYVALRDRDDRDLRKIAFDQGWLWIDMGKEGINHSGFSDLFTALFFLWALHHPEILYTSLGRCLLEKPGTQACVPDLVLYVRVDFPIWQPGEPRRIDLNQWRVPNLVGEISDTTLANDLDQQKHLYAALGIPEYWVIDVQGRRVFAFLLDEAGNYQPCSQSEALKGLPIALLEQTIEKLMTSTNTAAAGWFAQQISGLTLENTPQILGRMEDPDNFDTI